MELLKEDKGNVTMLSLLKKEHFMFFSYMSFMLQFFINLTLQISLFLKISRD